MADPAAPGEGMTPSAALKRRLWHCSFQPVMLTMGSVDVQQIGVPVEWGGG